MWKTIVTPRFGDADPLRHINNTMLPVWFELGWNPMIKTFHPSLDYDSWPLILARITVDFVSQMRYGADIEIHTYIRKYGRSSLTVYQEAHQNGRLGAKGEAVLVHFDYATQRSAPITEAVARILEQNLVSPDNPNLRSRSGRLPAIGRQRLPGS